MSVYCLDQGCSDILQSSGDRNLPFFQIYASRTITVDIIGSLCNGTFSLCIVIIIPNFVVFAGVLADPLCLACALIILKFLSA